MDYIVYGLYNISKEYKTRIDSMTYMHFIFF